MLPAMNTRRQTRPLLSYLLRVHEEHVQQLRLSYELLDLASGTALRFTSLAALQRHLRRGEAGEPVARTNLPAQG